MTDFSEGFLVKKSCVSMFVTPRTERGPTGSRFVVNLYRFAKDGRRTLHRVCGGGKCVPPSAHYQILGTGASNRDDYTRSCCRIGGDGGVSETWWMVFDKHP